MERWLFKCNIKSYCPYLRRLWWVSLMFYYDILSAFSLFLHCNKWTLFYMISNFTCSSGDENVENVNREEKIVSHLQDLEHLLEIIKKRLSSQHFLVIKMIMQLSLFTSKVALMLGNDSSGYAWKIIRNKCHLILIICLVSKYE